MPIVSHRRQGPRATDQPVTDPGGGMVPGPVTLQLSDEGSVTASGCASRGGVANDGLRRSSESSRLLCALASRKVSAEVPLALDELEDRGVVVDVVRDVVATRIRRDDHRRHAESVAIVAAGLISGGQVGWDVVGRDGARRRDMVVVAAVLVVEPDEQRLRPTRAGHDRVDDLGANCSPTRMSSGFSSEPSLLKVGPRARRPAAFRLRRR